MASSTTSAAGHQSPPRPAAPTTAADATLDTLITAIAASRGCSTQSALQRIWEYGPARAASEGLQR